MHIIHLYCSCTPPPCIPLAMHKPSNRFTLPCIFLPCLPTTTYPEIVSLSALIGCNVKNWPGGAAISRLPKFHHWLMLYILGQYIVNVRWSKTSDKFLTIIIFGIRATHELPPLSARHVPIDTFMPPPTHTCPPVMHACPSPTDRQTLAKHYLPLFR